MGQAPPRGPGPGPYHVPVMAAEVVEIFRPIGEGLIVDATFGGGGHCVALLEGLRQVRILAVDRDPDAAAAAPTDPRLQFAAGNFADLGDILKASLPSESTLDEAGGDNGAVAGVLFDLGVSSHQLDTAARGFSYHRRGPLDMRMNQASAVGARDVVNGWPLDDLSETIRRYGEERFARRIARAIVAARPIDDTTSLAAVIAGAVPAAARRRRHPARRTFQAIRIAVNDELGALEKGLDEALDAVRPGGRVAVITYHSLEDRIVKRRFAAGTAGCDCPPDFPVCVCGRTTELRSLTRGGLTPSMEEISRNPRARSARMRAVERVPA